MPLELVSTESISPLISLDALLPPARLDNALSIPLRRVPDGLVSNNEVISAEWVHGVDANEQAFRDFLLLSDVSGEVRTDGTPPGQFNDDATMGPVTSLEPAHTDLETFKPSDRPKHAYDQVLDKMATMMAKWEEQVSKATSQVQTGPDLINQFGDLSLMRMHETMHGTGQPGINATQIPSSQPGQNSLSVNTVLQSQMALQKMAEATSSFLHALDRGEVSVKLIGSPYPFVPLAPPSLLHFKLL